MVKHAILGRADESGHHGNDSVLQQGPQPRFATLARAVHDRIRAAVIRIGDNQFGGFDGFAAHAEFLEGARHHGRGEPFAEARDGVQSARRQFAQQRGAFAEPFTLAKISSMRPRACSRRSFEEISAASAASCCLRNASKIAAAGSRSPASELLGSFNQTVRDAAHRGYDGDHRALRATHP